MNNVIEELESQKEALVILKEIENDFLHKVALTDKIYTTFDAILKDLNIKNTDVVGWQYLYVVKFNNELLKVGRSGNPRDRILQLNSSSPNKVEQFYISYPTNKAPKLESKILFEVKRFNFKGEFALMPFDKAISIVKSIVGSPLKIDEVLSITKEAAADNVKRHFTIKAIDAAFKEFGHLDQRESGFETQVDED